MKENQVEIQSRYNELAVGDSYSAKSNLLSQIIKNFEQKIKLTILQSKSKILLPPQMIQEPDLSNQNLATSCALPGVKLTSQFCENDQFQRGNCSLKEIYDFPIQMTESFELTQQNLSYHQSFSQAEIELYSPPNSQETASTQGSFQHQKVAKKIKKAHNGVPNSCPNSPSEQKLKQEKTKRAANSSIKSAPQKKPVEQQTQTQLLNLFSLQIQKIQSTEANRAHSMEVLDNFASKNVMRNQFPSTPQNHHHNHHLDNHTQQKDSIFKKVSNFLISKDQSDDCISPISKNDKNFYKQQNILGRALSQAPISPPYGLSKAVQGYFEKCWKDLQQVCSEKRKNALLNKRNKSGISEKANESQEIIIPVDKIEDKLKKQRFNSAQMVGGKPFFTQDFNTENNNNNRNINYQKNNSNEKDNYHPGYLSIQMKPLEATQSQQILQQFEPRLLFHEASTPTMTPIKAQEQQKVQLNTCPLTIKHSFDMYHSSNFQLQNNQQSSNYFSNHLDDNQQYAPLNCFSQASPNTPLIQTRFYSQTENFSNVTLQQPVIFPEFLDIHNENHHFNFPIFQENQYQQQFVVQSAEPSPSYKRQLFRTESSTNYDDNMNLDQVISTLNLNSSPILEQTRKTNQFNFLDQINLDESDGQYISDEKLFEVIGEIKE